MAAPIQSPTKCEVHSVIRFLNAKGESPVKIHKQIVGYRKLCTRWVPKMLKDNHKTKRMGSTLKFLTRYSRDGDEFLDLFVTGDETWVFHHTPESKQQSLEW